jgi:aspartate/methionine/tyrosine aminotransferase
MRNALFPHMEWAKAHSRHPLPVELGFSGAKAPSGRGYREHGSGEPELEGKIARRYGVPKDHVYLVGGTSLANFVAIAAFCDAGDTVAVETPRYAPLAEIPRGLGATVVDLPRLDRPLGPVPDGVTLAVVSTPHNPTGRLLTDDEWAGLARFADKGGVVLVDEVYRDLQGRPPKVAAARHTRFLTTASFTKAYGLGALRLGWILGAPDLLAQVRRADNLISVQVATPSVLAVKRAWPRLDALRRKALANVPGNLRALRRSGLRFVEPQAGLTAIVHVGDGDKAASALERQGIGVARGSFFGAAEYVRIALHADPKDFEKGLLALRRYCGL